MDSYSPADAVPVRLAAERLHRLDTLNAWGRLRFDRASGQRPGHEVRRAASRRELVLNLAAARRPVRAGQ